MLASKHVGGAFVNHPNLFSCCKEGIENGNIGKEMRGTERHQLVERPGYRSVGPENEISAHLVAPCTSYLRFWEGSRGYRLCEGRA